MLVEVVEEFLKPGELEKVFAEVQEWFTAREVDPADLIQAGELITARTEDEILKRLLQGGSVDGVTDDMKAGFLFAMKVGYEAAARQWKPL